MICIPSVPYVFAWSCAITEYHEWGEVQIEQVVYQQLWHLVRSGLSLWVDSFSVVCSSGSDRDGTTQRNFFQFISSRPELVSSEPCRGLTLRDDGSAVRISESSCVQITVSCETNGQNMFHLQECWQKEICRLFLFFSVFLHVWWEPCSHILKTQSFSGGEYLTTTGNTDRLSCVIQGWLASQWVLSVLKNQVGRGLELPPSHLLPQHIPPQLSS